MSPPSKGAPYGPEADPGPPGLAAKLLGFCEELRGEGVAVGTSEILDAFAALGEVEWTSHDDFREALAATIAKSQEDRRVFELLFDRHFFRAAEAEAVARGIGESGEGAVETVEGEEAEGARIDIDELREQIREAMLAGDEDRLRDLARLAIAAFGRGEGSGVVGVDVQRIRRTLGLTAGSQPPDEGGAERPPIDRSQLNLLRAPSASRARTRPDRAHLDPALPRGRWPSSTALCRPARPRTLPPSTEPSRR